MKIYLESLGCAKNLVDSELMLGAFTARGMRVCHDPETAEAIVVNTCGFIEPAVTEAIDTILELARYKETGLCRRLIVCGCLPQRYGEAIAESLPEVDAFFGTGAYDRVGDALTTGTVNGRCILPSPESMALQCHTDQRLPGILGNPHTVYMKIAEGCDRRCTYCIIPRLRGRQRSRRQADIVEEAIWLAAGGAAELVLAAQETTAYGRDLCPPVAFSDLLAAIAAAVPRTRVRVLYMHPASIDLRLIRVMAERENICNYFDVPVQHVSNRLLRKMGRRHTSDDLYRLFDDIRDAIPDAALRTTVMTGFPGEREADIQDLLAFVRRIEFDHLGAFVYSDADDLTSHRLDGHVPAEVAGQRYDAVMAEQSLIAGKRNARHVGREYEVLIEDKEEDGLYSGRTWFQAPEVDGVTFVTGSNALHPGDRVPVRINGAMEYDLNGGVVA
ncbi:MAG: 30S ribosomal protein S12 methylthiotransferase RimO [Thermodesulfobacteriota bacterium]|nr:30S ribosomal protein S12 methylthiotransferase RimO [Thermodesulfobacteriota bacterium]